MHIVGFDLTSFIFGAIVSLAGIGCMLVSIAMRELRRRERNNNNGSTDT